MARKRSEVSFEESTFTALIGLVLLDKFCFFSLEFLVAFGSLAWGQKNSRVDEGLGDVADLERR